MIIRCELKVWSSGATHWMPVSLEEKGKVLKDLRGQPAIFLSDEGEGLKDLRKDPPFYQILPCPWCGVEEDKNHDPLKHVHK